MSACIGYLGPSGTFTELACDQYLKHSGSNLSPKAYPSIPALFEGLKQGECQEIIAPIENTIEGSVSSVMDALIQSEHIIRGEWVCDIQQCLLAKGSIAYEQISDIYSHPQPIAQSRHFIHERLPQATIHYTSSSADAVTKLDDASNPNTAAVIGSQRLSEIYGLSILEENIQDLENNQTRFLIVASEGVPASKNDRTSIVCSAHKNQPGSLHRLLGVFEKAGLNLTQVLSRPSKLELGEYIFFLEFLGHQDDPPVHAVLQEIKDMCLYYKYLGSYPIFSD